MVRRSFILLSLACFGCQSGRIGRFQFSENGRVVAFADDGYPNAAYVADSAGVRAVGNGTFILSPDGLSVLLFEPRLDVGHGLHEGDLIRFVDLRSSRTWRMRMPEGIGAYGMFAVHVLRQPENETADHPPWSEPFAVFFGPRNSFSLGPFPDGAYWSWQPERGWRRAERPTDPCIEMPDALAPRERPPSIVQLEPDGWNARRTVWHTPTGSTVELLRRNDLPSKLAGLIVTAPVGVFSPFWWMGVLAD